LDLIVVKWVRAEVQYFVSDLSNVLQCFYEDAAIDIQIEPGPSCRILEKPGGFAKGKIASARCRALGIGGIDDGIQVLSAKMLIDQPSQPSFNFGKNKEWLGKRGEQEAYISGGDDARNLSVHCLDEDEPGVSYLRYLSQEIIVKPYNFGRKDRFW